MYFIPCIPYGLHGIAPQRFIKYSKDYIFIMTKRLPSGNKYLCIKRVIFLHDVLLLPMYIVYMYTVHCICTYFFSSLAETGSDFERYYLLVIWRGLCNASIIIRAVNLMH